jgi:hypothetical protein
MNGGREAAFAKPRMAHERGLEHEVARDAADDERVERLAHAIRGRLARRRVHDQLGDHRVVVHRDLAALVHAGVDAHLACGLRGRPVAHEAPDRRQEVAHRILGVDAALRSPSRRA